MNRTFARLVAGSLLGLGASLAQAHNCVGFGDLAGEDPFCPSVSWLKNREVTLGCATNLYCPDTVVTRLQMAAFLQRMGDRLTPELLSASGSVTDLGSAPADGALVAAMPAGAAVPYARRVNATYVCSVAVTGPVLVGLDIPFSTDGGATWSPVDGLKANAFTMLATTDAANQRLLLTVQGERTLAANTTERYAARIRQLAGGGSMSQAECTGQGVAVQMPDPPPP